jgi:hypothetical protein
MWKKRGMGLVERLPRHCMETLRETTETLARIASALAEVPTGCKLPSFMHFKRYKLCTEIARCVHRIIFLVLIHFIGQKYEN